MTRCFDDGGFVVAWNQPFGFSGAAQPFFRRFDSSGTPIGDDVLIDDAVGPLSDVCRGPDGGFVVVGTSAYFTRLVAKRYDGSGSPIGTAFVVGPSTGGQYGNPLRPACCGNDDEFVVVWDQSSSGSGALRNVHGQRYDSDSMPVGTTFQANSYTTGYQQAADVACSDSGSFVVVWETGRDATSPSGSMTQDGLGFGIAGQRYQADGNAAGTEFLANTNTQNNQQSPTVAADAAGAFMVSWVHNANGTGDSAIRGQAFDASGVPSGTEIGISSNGRNLQDRPDSTGSAAGIMTIAWDATELVLEDRDVFVERLALEGSSITTTTTTTIPSGGACGDPVDPPSMGTSLPGLITASDALFVLNVAVGFGSCASCVCDVDGSGLITATDALSVLRAAVGQPVALSCPPC